jgi:hypothetical protein
VIRTYALTPREMTIAIGVYVARRERLEGELISDVNIIQRTDDESKIERVEVSFRVKK